MKSFLTPLLLFMFCLAVGQNSAAANPRRNVLLVVADLGYADVRFRGC